MEKKLLQVQVDADMHADYEWESLQQSADTGKRISMSEVVRAELERGRQRFKNKRKTAKARS